MSGAVVLQGGAEFADVCRPMDTEVLGLSGEGPVVVVAVTNENAHDHDTTTAEAIAYYSSLGATDVRGTPDVYDDLETVLEQMRAARLVVLPGGSPGRGLAATTDTVLGEAIRDHVLSGGVVSGSSAGAMILCEWTLVRIGTGVQLRRGLGLVPGAMVLPHFGGDTAWLDAVRDDLPADTVVLGIPECSGVIATGVGDGVRDGGDDRQGLRLRDVGVSPVTVVHS